MILSTLKQLMVPDEEKQEVPEVRSKELGRPTAFVYCSFDLYFSADFIVGMTLGELIEFLQVNCAYRTIDCDPNARIRWLPKKVIEANPDIVPFEYVIQEGDLICLAENGLPHDDLLRLSHEAQ